MVEGVSIFVVVVAGRGWKERRGAYLLREEEE